MSESSESMAQYGLSKRGERNAALMSGKVEKLFKVVRNQYDAKHNPNGVGE